MKTNYPQSFIDLLNSKHDYIGQGNPNAKILIIGKECSIAETEMTKNNFTDWEKNCAEETTIDNLPDMLPQILYILSSSYAIELMGIIALHGMVIKP